MSKGNPVPFKQMALAALLLGLPARVLAQSPYGLSARQTIPWVIDLVDERGPVWTTEIDVHNPGPASLTLSVTYLGALGTPTPGNFPCNPVTSPPGPPPVHPARRLSLAQGLNLRRLEMSARPSGVPEEPSNPVFTANARVSGLGGSLFAVEGFPEGYLSGARGPAAATGLAERLRGRKPLAFVLRVAASTP
jgi:hypothetical protein